MFPKIKIHNSNTKYLTFGQKNQKNQHPPIQPTLIEKSFNLLYPLIGLT
jgi:hypothetical protein